MTPPTVFISYSHKDEAEKETLLAHLNVLQHAGLIDVWSDDRIGVGSNWEQEIEQAVGQARASGQDAPPLRRREVKEAVGRPRDDLDGKLVQEVR